MDTDIDSSTWMLQTLFALEDQYGITIEENTESSDFRLNIIYPDFIPLDLDLSFWAEQNKRMESGEITWRNTMTGTTIISDSGDRVTPCFLHILQLPEWTGMCVIK